MNPYLQFTRYDYLTRVQLQKEVRRRKLGVYQNSSKLIFRLACIKDDISKGIHPFLTSQRELKIESPLPQQ